MIQLQARAESSLSARFFLAIVRATWSAGLALVAFWLTACSSAGQSSEPPPDPTPLTGVLTNLTQRSFTELATIELRVADGQTYVFQVEGDTGLTPSHAREHMTFVEPVTVHYRESPDGKVAYLITD